MEKSRAFFSAVRLPGKWINIILLAILVVIIALIVISRYTGGQGISGHVDISISPRFENLFGKDLTSALIKDFEKQRPDLRIAKAEEGADMLFFDDSEFGRLRSGGASKGDAPNGVAPEGAKLLSLTPYIAANTQDEEAAIEDAPDQDAQWALPLMSFMDLLFYNIDILQAANFDRPPKTRAEFLATARAVANTGAGQNSVYSFALDLPQGVRRSVYPWIWAAGGEICAPKGAAPTNDPPALSRTAVDIIAFFGQLQREGLLSPGPETGAQRLEEFAKGKIAMITSSASDIAFLQRSAGSVNFGVTAIPGTTQGKNRLGLSKIYAGISADCARPDEAWAFLSFIAGKSQVLAEALTAIPGSIPAVFPGEYIVKDPLYSKAWDIFEAAEIIEYPGDDPLEEETERLVRKKLMEQGIGTGNQE
ncbi:MAG: extracellular solute-binding protein [Treponema sp.]|jgi:multiple sugar transport system substrate-binding protein|nr:extracellular solute-binding protein [Treponema sp.]